MIRVHSAINAHIETFSVAVNAVRDEQFVFSVIVFRVRHGHVEKRIVAVYGIVHRPHGCFIFERAIGGVRCVGVNFFSLIAIYTEFGGNQNIFILPLILPFIPV